MINLGANPRDLVVSADDVRPPEHLASIDAIFVPIRDRPHNLRELLDILFDVGVPVYLIPTSMRDVVSLGEDHKERFEYLCMDDPVFQYTLENMRCNWNPFCTPLLGEWDLPAKRNFAIWYARAHDMKRVLLLDDDIRGIGNDLIVAGANALTRFDIAGYFVDDFPDTSVVGHAELAVGKNVDTFLSGSCLFVRTDNDVGFFPPIYNEDWLFMIPKIAQGLVTSLGSIFQKEYDPFADPLTAEFQEPGEVIADGLIAMIAGGQYDNRLERAIWEGWLNLHIGALEALLECALSPEAKVAVEAARHKCLGITGSDCVQFLYDWDSDMQYWAEAVKDLT